MEFTYFTREGSIKVLIKSLVIKYRQLLAYQPNLIINPTRVTANVNIAPTLPLLGVIGFKIHRETLIVILK